MIILLYAITGVLAGFFAGLFGVGGGLIVVPALLILFAIKGLDPGISTHLAIGTSLATIVITSISSTVTHHQKRNVAWDIFKRYGIGLAFGALIGAFVADLTPGPVLRTAFGLFAWVMAAQLALGGNPKPTRQVPKTPGLLGVGVLVGWVSSLFGIGGGPLTVPYLIFHNIQTRMAVGTSAACGLPIALAGAVGYLLVGLDAQNLPQYALGYVYLPAFFAIVVLSVPMARLGAGVASRMDPVMLKRAFAVVLTINGTSLVFG